MMTEHITLTGEERAALAEAATWFPDIDGHTVITHAQLVPALFEDLFEELEDGGRGQQDLLAAHRQHAATLGQMARSEPFDRWDALGACSWALRLSPDGRRQTQEGLAAARDKLLAADDLSS